MNLLLLLLACKGTAETDDVTDTDVDTQGEIPFPDEPTVLVINELMPSNQDAWADENGANPDWLELYNPTDADISLDGWSIGDSDDVATAERLAASLVVPAKGWLLLVADGDVTEGDQHLGFKLSGDGETVALLGPDATTGSKVEYGPMLPDVSWARVPDGCLEDDCWEAVPFGSPGTSNTVGPNEEVLAIGYWQDWMYLDTGDAPSDWADFGFEDDGWSLGEAPLGFGTDAAFTETSSSVVTTYFRYDFTLDADAVAATVGLRIDDGAVVYLDGVEILRENLPDEAVSADTFATSDVSGDVEFAFFDVSATELTRGSHVLAVELHQSETGGDDLLFDLQLKVLVPRQ